MPHTEREPTMSNPNLIITYGAYSADFNTLPEASLVGMLRRGFAHFMGSECASKVTAHFDPENESPVTDTPEARAVFKAQVQKEMFAKLVAGTVGVSTRGPAVDPIVTIENRIAKAQVLAVLKANKLAWPKKAEDKVELNGKAFTGAELIARRVANPKFAPGIKSEAKRVLAEQQKRAKAAEEAGKDSDLGDI